MKYARAFFNELVCNLSAKIEPLEAQHYAFMLLEYWHNFSKTDVLLNKEIPDKGIDYQYFVDKLMLQEPIQYVLGSTVFCGNTLQVTPAVLIPRPETEALVEQIIEHLDNYFPGKIVDVCTGSGAIAISLAKQFARASVQAIDISAKALQVAQKNALQNNVFIGFLLFDFLDENTWEHHFSNEKFDVLVSNPPYITASEKKLMKANILNFEPHIALFVADNSPLIFYEKIAKFGYKYLNNTGVCWVEINENFGDATREVFLRNGFKKATIIQDIHGKNRFILVQR